MLLLRLHYEYCRLFRFHAKSAPARELDVLFALRFQWFVWVFVFSSLSYAIRSVWFKPKRSHNSDKGHGIDCWWYCCREQQPPLCNVLTKISCSHKNAAKTRKNVMKTIVQQNIHHVIWLTHSLRRSLSCGASLIFPSVNPWASSYYCVTNTKSLRLFPIQFPSTLNILSVENHPLESERRKNTYEWAR